MERTRPILAEWQKRDPKFVHGFAPEWFNVWYEGFQYDARTETLTFTTTFESRHPPDVAPPIRSELRVSCAPMRGAARTCTETR